MNEARWGDAMASATESFRLMGVAAERMTRLYGDAITAVLLANRPGYYLRNGKVRRDHSYFRVRARARRAALKAARA